VKAEREAQRAQQEARKNMTYQQKAEQKLYQQFQGRKMVEVGKKEGQHFYQLDENKKAAYEKKWQVEFKQYQAKREARERADTERLFGKMTEQQ